MTKLAFLVVVLGVGLFARPVVTSATVAGEGGFASAAVFGAMEVIGAVVDRAEAMSLRQIPGDAGVGGLTNGKRCNGAAHLLLLVSGGGAVLIHQLRG
jgi:hypothetical protein